MARLMGAVAHPLVRCQAINCTAQAVQRIALHPQPGDPNYFVVQVCAEHRDQIFAETTPTENPPEEDR